MLVVCGSVDVMFQFVIMWSIMCTSPLVLGLVLSLFKIVKP